MIKFCSIFGFLIISVYANGEFTILHHPSSLVFKGHDHVKESILKEVFSASLGFSTEQHSNWDGLYIEDPFNLAEGVVVVAVEGVSDIGHAKGHHFPLKTDEDESVIFRALEKRVLGRYPEGNSKLIRVNLGNGLEAVHSYDIFEGIKSDKPKKSIHTHLKNSVDEDREFMKEITLLNAIANKIEHLAKTDNTPDVFWFKVSSLHPLTDLYGSNSTQVKVAKQILNEAIIQLNNAFNKAYKGRVLVSVIASDAIHTRRTRSILQVKADEPADEFDINLAKLYNKDYPVIFNIILWFGVTMVFSLFAICIAIGTMDPGRDSIIYRMTSTRMKKDN